MINGIHSGKFVQIFYKHPIQIIKCNNQKEQIILFIRIEIHLITTYILKMRMYVGQDFDGESVIL